MFEGIGCLGRFLQPLLRSAQPRPHLLHGILLTGQLAPKLPQAVLLGGQPALQARQLRIGLALAAHK